MLLGLSGLSFVISATSLAQSASTTSASEAAPPTVAEANKGVPLSPIPEPAAGGPQPSPPPPTAGGPGVATEIRPGGKPITLEAGKGTLIRLPRPASTVFIANPDVADVQVKSPSLIYLNAKAPGETALYAVDADDRVLVNVPVRVGHDLSRLRQSMLAVAPSENVNVSSVDNRLILNGKVATAGDAQKVNALAKALADETKGSVVNQLSVATPNQVNIRVRIAEVNRTVLKSLGINITRPTLGGKLQAGGLQVTTDNPFTVGQITDTNLFTAIFGAQGARIAVTLDALAQENLLTVLAEPNLTALSGQPANFLAGGKFFIPVPQFSSGTAPTITLQPETFGVELDMTPTVIDSNHLNLHIRPEVSELSTEGAVMVSGFNIPSLTVRHAETTVELASGDSFVLAGLLQNTSTQNISKIPGLGDIPVLGQLFRSEQFQRNETELVIIVTPYLVKPTETSSLRAPTNGFVAPHDAQRAVNGDLYRQSLPSPGKGPIPPDKGLIGPAGFVLE
jgi:pilus assembly protein CpaC